jgi:hypothetical protein
MFRAKIVEGDKIDFIPSALSPKSCGFRDEQKEYYECVFEPEYSNK